MPKAKVRQRIEGLRGQKVSTVVWIWCPGCDEHHAVKIANDGWTFNGDEERPTLRPSLLVRSGHYSPGHTGPCWCSYNAEHPNEESKFKCRICHSFITDGKIQFLSDSTHALAGQTVELPEVDM